MIMMMMMLRDSTSRKMFIFCTFAQYSVSRFAGYKKNLFPVNHNIGRSGRYRSSVRFTTRSLLSIAHLHAIHVT